MKANSREFSILLVDDDAKILSALEILIASEGYQVYKAADAKTALKILKTTDIHLVLSDIMMPGISGMDLLKKIKSTHPEIIVVLMTGYSSVPGAINAIRDGAQDYLIKPINTDDVILMVERNYQQFKRNQRAVMLRQEATRHKSISIVGSSPRIEQVKEEISQVAPVDISVLITGESGTGKELVARSIHEQSLRKDNLFVAINCASIPSDLLESELFGHEKGAFSGAVTRKYGLFEVADKGTLLLDEIGEMASELQAKILRTIETGTFRRLGGTSEITSDFRIVSATNRDLQQSISENQFRADLFFRLNQFNIEVPPLRQRKSDILELVEYFFMEKGRENISSATIPDTLELLLSYDWPGNIRELFNALERAHLLAGTGLPLPKHFPPEIRMNSVQQQTNSNEPTKTLAEVENKHILEVYNRNSQNKPKTAKALGISVRSLYNKLKAMDLS